MRAYYYVHVPALESAQSLRLLLRCTESRYHIHVDRKSACSARDRLIMLKREDGCGNEYRHLLSAKHRLVSGAKRDLGLTESNVAAKKSVHRDGGGHILFDILNSLKLSRSFVVFKCRLKILLQVVILGERKSRAAHSLGVQLDKLLRHLLDRRLSLSLSPCPLPAAKL